jgi:hypothetical protein
MNLQKISRVLSCAMFLFVSDIVVGAAADAPIAKMIKKFPRVFLNYDSPEVLPQAQVGTIALQLGLIIEINGKSLSSYPAAINDKKTDWAIIDLQPGIYEISARPVGGVDPNNQTNLIEDIVNLFSSKESKEARRNKPKLPTSFQRMLLVRPGEIYGLTYTMKLVSKSYRKSLHMYNINLGEEKDEGLRAAIDDYRRQYKTQLASMPVINTSANEAAWGKKWTSVPIKAGTPQAEVIDRMKNALNYEHWRLELANDTTIIASLMTKPLHRSGLYMKYNGSSVDIYGDELNKDWIKPISDRLAGSLKFASADVTRRFSLEYPEDNWGVLLSEIPVADGAAAPNVRQTIVKAMQAYRWVIEDSNDSLVIGSLIRGDTKHALYAKYDSSGVKIYGEKNIKGWAENVKKAFLKYSRPASK